MQLNPKLQIKLDEASYLDRLDADPDVHDVTAERVLGALSIPPDSTPDSRLNENYGCHADIRVPSVLFVAVALVVLVVAGAVCVATQL